MSPSDSLFVCLRASFARQTFGSWSEPIAIGLPISVSQFTERVSVRPSIEFHSLMMEGTSVPEGSRLFGPSLPRLELTYIVSLTIYRVGLPSFVHAVLDGDS